MIRLERQADQTRDSQTQRQRSIRASTGRPITGKVSEVGADLVCVNTGDTANYIPFHAIVHFQQSGTETFSAEYIGTEGISK